MEQIGLFEEGFKQFNEGFEDESHLKKIGYKGSVSCCSNCKFSNSNGSVWALVCEFMKPITGQVFDVSVFGKCKLYSKSKE